MGYEKTTGAQIGCTSSSTKYIIYTDYTVEIPTHCSFMHAKGSRIVYMIKTTMNTSYYQLIWNNCQEIDENHEE